MGGLILLCPTPNTRGAILSPRILYEPPRQLAFSDICLFLYKIN